MVDNVTHLRNFLSFFNGLYLAGEMSETKGELARAGSVLKHLRRARVGPELPQVSSRSWGPGHSGWELEGGRGRCGGRVPRLSLTRTDFVPWELAEGTLPAFPGGLPQASWGDQDTPGSSAQEQLGGTPGLPSLPGQAGLGEKPGAGVGMLLAVP